MPSIGRTRCSTIDRTTAPSRFGPAAGGFIARDVIANVLQKQFIRAIEAGGLASAVIGYSRDQPEYRQPAKGFDNEPKAAVHRRFGLLPVRYCLCLASDVMPSDNSMRVASTAHRSDCMPHV